MAEVIDYLRDQNNVLRIANGDFVKGDATNKHQQTLLVTEAGEFKQFPTAGVGLMNFMLGDNTADDLRTAIQKEFEADGMHIIDMTISGTAVQLDAQYNEPD